ncbi:MAG: PPC domain-containing protein [Kofleriaceae bacterium]|nr:PPC domain-containing protein [Myxococcales bacterium]MCB9565475.1 PPC domain-containing protein [Kofleriaceae bacterium]MCB9573213.1 PPC domain-containing protein [Kofleriaceae bacterium]
MSRRAGTALLAAGVGLAGVGCGKHEQAIRRDRDAGAAVEVVDRGQVGARTSGDEREPNDRDADATPTAPGSLVRGSLDGETDVDVYKIAVPTTGQLRVMVGGIDGVDLKLELRDDHGAVLARSDRGPAGTVEGFPDFGVVKGDYFLAVAEYVKPRKKPKKAKKPKKGAPDAAAEPVGRTGPSPVYELTIDLVERAPDLTEIEPDDDAGTAVEVLLADTVHGWIGWSGDVDLWKLSLEGIGERYGLDVEVAGVDGLKLAVEVLDAGGEIVQARKGDKGGPVVIQSIVPSIAPDQPPWYFVKIAADRSNPEVGYDLRFTTRLLEHDEEVEPNDDPARATPLRFDGVATSGTMRAGWVTGDVDRFLLEPQPDAVLLDVGVEPPPGVDLSLEVALADGAMIAAGDAAGPGKRERLSGVAIPAGQGAIVTVKAKPTKQDSGEVRPYRLTWSFTPGELPMPPEETDDGAGDDDDDGAAPIGSPDETEPGSPR